MPAKRQWRGSDPFCLVDLTLCLRQVPDYAESTSTEPLAEWIANFDIGIVPDPA
jgi:hypothetical protein